MMSAKLATLDFFKIKEFWNKGYDVVISSYDVTNKIALHDSKCILDKVIRPRYGNASISMKEVIVTSILWTFDQKNQIFWGIFLVKFTNLGLALGMALKFNTKMEKG